MSIIVRPRLQSGPVPGQQRRNAHHVTTLVQFTTRNVPDLEFLHVHRVLVTVTLFCLDRDRTTPILKPGYSAVSMAQNDF
jgi:hypothetical protein